MSHNGKTAFVNLKTRQVRYEKIPEKVHLYLLGGRGYSAYYLYSLISKDTLPLSDENPLIISPGLMTGMPGISTSRCSIAAKSPETGFLGESNIGGHFPALLKKNGYDCLIIENTADKPVNILINEDEIKVVEADQYWGMDTYRVQDELKKDYGSGVKILCVGPAGENLVRFACIRSDKKNSAGRTGMGCLMGFKKLKAIIAFPSKNKRLLADPEKYKKYFKDLYRVIKEDPMSDQLHQYGTPWLYDLVCEGVYMGRTYNGLTNFFQKRENISTQELMPFITKKHACYSCPIACMHSYEVKEGKYKGVNGVGPEFGVMGSFGPMLGIPRIEPVLAANDLVNKWGLDTSSTGNMVAWAMELYDRGIITKEDTGGLELTWGNDDVFLQLIEQMTFRKGFGDLLAKGAKEAIAEIGKDTEQYMSMVKNLPQSDPADMRFFRGFALGVATATRGADHLRSRPFYEPFELPEKDLEEIYGECVDPVNSAYKTKGRVVQWWESYLALFDVTGMCKLIGLALMPNILAFKQFAELINLSCGTDFTEEEIFDVGERVTNLERMFIAREGIRRKDDNLPVRYYKPLEWDNTGADAVVEADKFQELLTEYYQKHGWDEKTGIPTMETLKRLKLTEIHPEDDLNLLEKEVETEQAAV